METNKTVFVSHIVNDILPLSKFSDEEKKYIADVAWYGYTSGKLDALNPDDKSCIFNWKDTKK